MIIPLLVRVICNDVRADRSIILSARNRPFATTLHDVAGEKQRINRDNNRDVERLSLNEQIDSKYDNAINLKASLDDHGRKRYESLAQKLADEALKSPKLQRNMKKLTDISETRHFDTIKNSAMHRMRSVPKPAASSRKLSKLLNHKERRKRKRNKHRHGIKRRKEYHPRLHRRNHIKVGKV